MPRWVYITAAVLAGLVILYIAMATKPKSALTGVTLTCVCADGRSFSMTLGDDPESDARRFRRGCDVTCNGLGTPA
jgi:hypothetical protein